jgi:hypothetical protein
MTDTPGEHAVPRRRLDARVRTLPDRTIVAGPELVLELDDTARFIWRHIDGSMTISAIARQVAVAYDVDIQTALDDVSELIFDLRVGRIVDIKTEPE